MKQNKTFDAVKAMREIREKLSEKYWKLPDILKKEMQEVREKYNLQLTISQKAKAYLQPNEKKHSSAPSDITIFVTIPLDLHCYRSYKKCNGHLVSSQVKFLSSKILFLIIS